MRFSQDCKEKEAFKSSIEENAFTHLYQADKYECKLSDSLQKLAKKELQEDPKRREAALDQMRHHIQKTSTILKCRIDSNFLLRFLRFNKFSVLGAQESLMKYIMMRQEYPDWFYKTSLDDPVVLDLINRGVVFALPQRDSNGRRCVFTVGGNIDPRIHTAEHVMKAMMVCIESLLEDEENQIRGFSYFLDEGGLSFSHLSLWNPTEFSKMWSTCEKAIPTRHKSLDFISMPSIVLFVYEYVKKLMSSKLRSRIVVHKDQNSFLKCVDKRILPKEYGGEIPMAKMIEIYKSEVSVCQGRLRELDQMKVDVQSYKKSEKTCTSATRKLSSIQGTTGSFRKLEID